MHWLFQRRAEKSTTTHAAHEGRAPTTGNFIAVVGNYAEGDLSRRVKRYVQQATSLPVYSINASSILQVIDFSESSPLFAQEGS